jgi:hypothetical protein
MTKTQYLKKCKELKKEACKLIDNRIEKALKSGAIDLFEYGDDYILPKIVMSAIGHEMEFQFKPHSREDINTLEKLKLFL